MYAPSPTVEDFVHACASGPLEQFRVLMLIGARGTGKTTGALYALICLGQRMQMEGQGSRLPLRVAVVRDTWKNLQRTTIATLNKQANQGLPITFLDGGEQALIGPWLHLYFFGMDTRADVDKLQGFECAVLWIEEAAPGAELDVGIPAETFGIGATSVRQEGVPHRIILTENPPDEDHWSLQVDKVLMDKGITGLVFERFDVPPGERSAHFLNLATRAAKAGRLREAAEWRSAAEEYDKYRTLNEAFLEAIGRHDLADRLARGKIGGVQIGEAIIGSFVRELHVTQPGERLIALPGAQLVRCWDSGLTPSCVWVQKTGAGNVDVLGSRTAINRAMAQLILEEVVPFQQKYQLYPRGTMQGHQRGARMGFDFRDVGDPSLFQGDHINNANLSAGLTIEQMLNTSVEPGPIEWAHRRDAGNIAFDRPALGRARLNDKDRSPRPKLIRIQADENDLLIKGAAGRAHYVVDPASGRINPDIKAAKRACVDAETEILTVAGWKRHDALRKGEMVYGYSYAGHRLVECALVDIHRYDGWTPVIRYESGSLSMVVTPDHRCVVRRRLSKRRGPDLMLPVEDVYAKDLQTSHYLVRTAPCVKRAILSDGLVRLCAWIMAEGSYKHPGVVTICQSPTANPQYVGEIDALLDSIPHRRRSGRQVVWDLGPDESVYIRLLMPGKIAGPELIRRLSPYQAALFLYEMARGDGHWQGLGDVAIPPPPKPFAEKFVDFSRGATVRIHQFNPRAADALQHIAMLAGLGAKVARQPASGAMTVTLTAHRDLTALYTLRRTVEEAPFVWCPQTEMGTWVARRGGRVFITKNSGLYFQSLDALLYYLAMDFPAHEYLQRERRQPPAEPPPRDWLGA